jgi:hypothetical protein
VEARAEAAKAVERAPDPAPSPAGNLKDAFLDELRKTKKFFYGTVVAQAQRIDVEPERLVFTFTSQHRALREQLDQNRPHLESVATRLAGRRMSVVSAENGAASAPAAAAEAPPDRQTELRKQAMADTAVQAMLDVFSTEIKDVEEM